ncbi:MAG: SAVED domain-containing protein [Promethearchaeota archaeon]|jgi:hypothetical protein
MTESMKSGAGIQEGFEFQYWYGVKLVIDWKISPPNDLINPPWLKEEIGRNEFGIFDDILMYKDSTYYFYQIKKSFSTMGGLIDESDLLDEKSNLSILEMYKSYTKIKKKHPNENFYLINVSNKVSSGILREIIVPNENRIEDSFIKNNIKKPEKIKFREAIKEMCGGKEIDDFLERLLFVHYDNPEFEVKQKSILPRKIVLNLFNWVKKIAQKRIKNSENKISYGDFQFLLNIDELKVPLRVGFYSKSEFPSEILYDYSLDFFSQIDVPLNKIDWDKFREEIEDLRKIIIKESQNRLIRIEALSHLTLGYIIGFVFRSTTGFKLQVHQQFKDLEEIWKYESNNTSKIEDNIEIINTFSNDNSKDLVVSLEFTNKPVKHLIMEYLTKNEIGYKEVIEIKITTPISANQVTPLVNYINNIIVNVKGIKIIHLFSAIPLALAILLGYNFNAMPSIQLYEFDMAKRMYIPSYKLNQKTSK